MLIQRPQALYLCIYSLLHFSLELSFFLLLQNLKPGFKILVEEVTAQVFGQVTGMKACCRAFEGILAAKDLALPRRAYTAVFDLEEILHDGAYALGAVEMPF